MFQITNRDSHPLVNFYFYLFFFCILSWMGFFPENWPEV